MTVWSFQRKNLNAVLKFVTAFLLSLTLGRQADAQTTASFYANPTDGCPPLTVDFTNASLQANSFYWNFGNGNTSTLADPTTAYLTSGFYTVTLIATNTLTGQKDTLVATNYIHVTPTPTINFTATPPTTCSNSNLVTFNNTTTGAVSYIWDFGDGNSSTLQNPTHLYSAPGSYTVKLIATNSFGCQNISIKNNYITVNPAPDASFTSDYTSACNVNQVFNFTNNGTGITSWQWDFGDGNSSSLQNPSHTYASAGSYDVTLIVTNNFGCSDTLVANNYISIGGSLVPSYTVNNSLGCGTLNAHFTCTVPNATSWTWNFGDGSPVSNLQNPIHQYTSTGSYTITLTVTTSSGCNGTKTFPNAIIIDPLPTANFSTNQVNPCNPYVWHFTNLSTNGINYLWEFGDGTTSTQFQPNHTYATATSFNVTLHVYSAHGCEATLTLNDTVDIHDYNPTISATPKVGCKPLPVAFTAGNYPSAISWFWKFGDGATSTLQNPSHTYTANGNYTVTLKITTSAGCIDSIVKPNFIRVVPGQINYTVPDTIVGCTPYTASFTDPTDGSNFWHWDFGDGDTSNIKNPSHLYMNPGIYVVTLQTSMPGGCSQFFNPYAIVQVFEFIPDSIVVISMSPCSPYQLQLTNNTSGVQDWIWDFGDGTTSTLQSPTHIYTQPGTYTISLTMVAIVGCRIVQDLTVTFGHANPISITNASTCTDDTIHFSMNNPGAFSSHSWDFGDGSPLSSATNPSHIYPVPGDYTVTLSTTDTSGCIDVFTDTLYIRNVNAGFTTNNSTTLCDHANIHFINTSTGATSYLWNFGDGTSSTSTNPVHNFVNEGTFTVTLTASAGGCVKTVSQLNYITVNIAHADFSYTSSGSCIPITAVYTDLSINPVSWIWSFGDGDSSTAQNPVHIFNTSPTSLAKLRIIDTNGCIGVKNKNNVNAINVYISASDTVGCNPLQVNFNDLTSTAVAWHWDFGDGGVSTLETPTHTFTDTGSYNITLIVTLAAGCVDTMVFPNYIHVVMPLPDFVSPTVAVCAPSLVTFNNLSQNTVSYLWDFGDGTTSTADNPSHIYNIPGDYTISLTAYDSLGCSGTIVKVDYIHVPGTFSYFTLASQTNCLQTFVQFLDSSINATSWSWNFGDGYTSTLQNPQHLYQDTGSYIVSLITSDSLGCSSFYSFPYPIVVHPNPDALVATTSYGGCSPYAASFTNQSAGASTYIWYFGDGDTSDAISPVHIYQDSGTFYVSLVAITSFGCTDTFNVYTPVIVKLSPHADFSDSITSGCIGTSFALNNISTNLFNPAFSWTIGSQTSTQQSPVFTLNTPGFYDVTLVITNSNGCSDSILKPNFIQIYDTLPPPVSPILSVSVKNNTSVDIKWLPNAALDLEEYRLYRLNPSTSIYNLIYSELHPNNSNANVTGIYTDTALNTLQNVYTYKLQTIDHCGYKLSLDSSVAHTTINVTAVAQGINITVDWTPYYGCPVSTYEIHRVEVQNGSSQLLAIVPPTQLNYVDSNLNCPFEYSYRITATDLCGNLYTSLSDTSIAIPENTLADQKVDVVRSTVVFNKSVLTEWREPVVAPNRVMQYNILRSIDNLSFSFLASVPASVHSYVDEQVDVNHQNYFYKVDVISDCNLAGLKSNNSSSILLQSDWVNEKPKLWWTEYNKWDTGVDYYTIEKINDSGQWVLIKTVNGTTTETVLDD